MDAKQIPNKVDFEKLSKKYYFKDDGPSFRLFEFLDVNGKTIDEPELWRPVEMGPEEYADQIQVKIPFFVKTTRLCLPLLCSLLMCF